MPKSMLPIPLLLVPGWRNSGPHHWQSRWQLLHPEMARVDFGEWHHPHPRAWTDVLHQAVLASPSPPLLIAHSLGCLAVANVMALRSILCHLAHETQASPRWPAPWVRICSCEHRLSQPRRRYRFVGADLFALPRSHACRHRG